MRSTKTKNHKINSYYRRINRNLNERNSNITVVYMFSKRVSVETVKRNPNSRVTYLSLLRAPMFIHG